jgi:hypothetical protein
MIVRQISISAHSLILQLLFPNFIKQSIKVKMFSQFDSISLNSSQRIVFSSISSANWRISDDRLHKNGGVTQDNPGLRRNNNGA